MEGIRLGWFTFRSEWGAGGLSVHSGRTGRRRPVGDRRRPVVEDAKMDISLLIAAVVS